MCDVSANYYKYNGACYHQSNFRALGIGIQDPISGLAAACLYAGCLDCSVDATGCGQCLNGYCRNTVTLQCEILQPFFGCDSTSNTIKPCTVLGCESCNGNISQCTKCSTSMG